MELADVFLGNLNHVKTAGNGAYVPHMAGQHPSLCILHCSDSRENFNLIADVKPSMGEIFKVENAGNVLDGSVSALGGVAYSVVHLGIKNVLVFGHTGCGAIKAAFGNYAVDAWPIADHIRLLEPVARLSQIIISRIEGRNVSREEICKNDLFLTKAAELNVAYQVNYLNQVFAGIGISHIKVYGAMHDLHGHYGGDNGKLYLVESPKEDGLDAYLSAYKKNLAVLDKPFGDIFSDLGISYNIPLKSYAVTPVHEEHIEQQAK
ncbi:MAG: carbonic anhydrase [Nanoarchaeota archaeon]|nr:hypothetical protein [Nanoarchaeota archaeon]MBU4299586.1 hypothetical protein [Nanoarchaeota archaeon]MBU4452107.1 hypothetical protein [Nanoarchaeota archaeon]MCG2723725.1 hypothetical protein [archaeon]